MKKPRAVESWGLVFTFDTKNCGPARVTHVQAWAGVERVASENGREHRFWVPCSILGEPHKVVTTEADARTLAEKDGAASGLPPSAESTP
jgi:hypothetical protein